MNIVQNTALRAESELVVRRVVPYIAHLCPPNTVRAQVHVAGGPGKEDMTVVNSINNCPLRSARDTS